MIGNCKIYQYLLDRAVKMFFYNKQGLKNINAKTTDRLSELLL